MMTVIAHDGTKLHVEDSGGTGRPVVLIHGWPLSGESWAPQVPALRDARLRVITYDRRGFGRSDKPAAGYDYDYLAADLQAVIEEVDLRDLSLVGFSMGGGEVARYLSRYGADRVRSVVFASAVPPYLAKTAKNPDGPLDKERAGEMLTALQVHRHAFFDDFTTQLLSANGNLAVGENVQRDTMCQALQSDQSAAEECLKAWATTDFRADLAAVTVPALIIHGDSDALVPFEGSGQRTHDAIEGSQLHVIKGGPHGVTMSHADEWNNIVGRFLAR
ncbi:alpha/beta fold hydrolase [Flexivirga alba]|uniref:Alpha/beta fold hydrolase n=1 Tax=Flexivirga alba TaxID=702742 RepID=A0ABW2AJR6_9MICO